MPRDDSVEGFPDPESESVGPLLPDPEGADEVPAHELACLEEAVETAPDVRPDRVTEIKRQVEDGTYGVPPEVLAARLLRGSS